LDTALRSGARRTSFVRSTTTPTPSSQPRGSPRSPATSPTRRCPFEVRRLGRTIAKWATQSIAWHQSHVSNGPTEATNNLVKRVKRTAFGFRRFEHYRIRALLYGGKPNWSLLDQLTPP
jgi:hypothetical protein